MCALQKPCVFYIAIIIWYTIPSQFVLFQRECSGTDLKEHHLPAERSQYVSAQVCITSFVASCPVTSWIIQVRRKQVCCACLRVCCVRGGNALSEEPLPQLRDLQLCCRASRYRCRWKSRGLSVCVWSDIEDMLLPLAKFFPSSRMHPNPHENVIFK